MTSQPNLIRHGAGYPVVMIPGLCFTHKIFEPLVPYLEDKYDLIFVDLPGHGENERVAISQENLVEFAGSISKELSDAGIDRYSVLGSSLGATVAYRLNSDFDGSKIDSVISVDQSPMILCGPDWQHGAFGQLDQDSAVQLTGSIESDYTGFVDTVLSAAFPGACEGCEQIQKDARYHALKCAPEKVAKLFHMATQEDWREGVVNSHQELLTIHGSQSAVYPTGVGQWVAENWQPTAHIEFSGCGHLPFLDHPGLFAHAVSGFIEEAMEKTDV